MSRRVYYQCLHCGVTTHNRNSRKKMFCSRDCYMEYRTSKPYSYNALHTWLWRNHRQDKTGICSHCKEESRTDWANISGNYTKNINDYIELCRKCHEKYDGKRHDLFRGFKHSELSKRRIAESVRRNRWQLKTQA